MTRRLFALFPVFLLSVAVGPPGARAQDATYVEVAPVLRERCAPCHAGAAAPLDLRLDSLDGLLAGSRNGPVVISGNPTGSELIRRVKGVSQPRMPMTGPPFLSDAEVNLLERWVVSGLKSGDVTRLSAAAPRSKVRPSAGEHVTYAHVAPIFATRCAKCHTRKGLMGPAPEGYRLTSYDETLATADRVRVVPEFSEASELVRRIRGQAHPRMPFDGPPFLYREEIELIVDWINQGARSSTGEPAPYPTNARVRLHGTLRSGWRLDALGLVVARSTRIDKSPGPGDYVQVRGRLADGGAVVAERIRRR